MDLVISEQELKAISLKPHEVRLEFALWLYQTGKWSGGKARQFLGLDIFEWRDKLFDRKIECHGGMNAFLEDVENLKREGLLKNLNINS